MARPRKHDGVVYRRAGSQFWWMRYWDRAGVRRHEPTGTADWKEAQKKLRERLRARDENVLDIVHKGERTTFREWAGIFLENYSKPPMRATKTYESHQRSVVHLKHVFGDMLLTELSADRIEGYLRAVAGASSAQDEGRDDREGHRQAVDGPLGASSASANPQR